MQNAAQQTNVGFEAPLANARAYLLGGKILDAVSNFFYFSLIGPAWADGAGERETRALQACVFDYPEAEHQCFDVPYYTCMGEQLGIAANANLARERCLYQELTIWSDLLREACDDLEAIVEPGTATWDALCFDNNAPNWSYITQGLSNSDEEPTSREIVLRLSSEDTRSFAVQLRRLLSTYQNHAPG